METKFKVGDVLNFNWNNWYGTAIKIHNYIRYGFHKDNKWTHSAIIAEINGDTAIVYEAIAKGFTRSVYSLETLDNWIKSGNMIRGVARKPLIDVKAYCKEYEGTPYGFLDIFSIVLYTLFGKLSFSINTGTKELICSEAVARILYDASDRKINFETEFKKRYDLICPIDLYKSTQIEWK